MFKFIYFFVALVILAYGVNCKAIQEIVSTEREEILDPKYTVKWEADFDNETIVFRVTVETTGFVGFGISPGGGMTGADLIMGGVRDDGTPYFQDYHAVASTTPIVDQSQDWDLLSYAQNETHTELEFTRVFDTCDADDQPINSDSTNFIWSYGETDEIGYHGTSNRGQSAVNILDPAMPDLDLSSFQKWEITRDFTMPANDTSYWCTMHKRPEFTDGKHHIIGFDALTPSLAALKHTHHLVISQCTAPDGTDPDEVFGPFVGFSGEACYDRPSAMPMDYCRSILYVWAIGGKVTLFPEHVGFPINEAGHEKEYILLEVHYDNPSMLDGVMFETGITVYHTAELRKEEAALLIVSHDIAMTHIIPPKSVGYTTVGHCSPACTQERIPHSGIHFFNVLQHSHLAGRKLKLRHYRDGVELPWIANDQHYNFNFQQNRPLRNEVTAYPGDQFSYECVTDTSTRNNVTLAGLSTRHEMCEAFLWYYSRQNFAFCGSLYFDLDKLCDRFEVALDVEWAGDYYDPTIVGPPNHVHVNKTWSQVLDEYDWTDQNKADLEKELRYSSHYAGCGGPDDPQEGPEARFKALRKMASDVRSGKAKYSMDEFITYPELEEEYAPPQICHVDDTTTVKDPTQPTTNAPGSASGIQSATTMIFTWSLVSLAQKYVL